MFKTLLQLSESKWYWLALMAFCVLMEATGLFYQYVLDYMPCMLCIHVRIWVLAMFIVSVIALLWRSSGKLLFLAQLLMTALCAGLLERSYQLLGTERGFLSGGCTMESGLPSWFALDSWFPLAFKVWEPCGYTPELLFGVTMAEGLIVMSSLLVVLTLLLTVSHAFRQFLRR